MENAEFILNEMRRQAELSCEERMTNEYNELFKDYVIDRNVEYPDPEYLIEIGGVPTLPKGNLVALSAKWKNGKTFFCQVLGAIFLGSDQFANCRSRQDEGRMLFFDTEQAESDTARIQKTIEVMTPGQRHSDFRVFCLREAVIDKDIDQNATVSRFDLINRAIMQEQPDLVFIDGIADLIYNYNDVIESQEVVNKLAAIANRHNCCIIVVMHQNKGRQDKNMKGHLGTMLYQKCSDVFNVEKCGSLFVASHAVSRHRNSEDIAFKLDANAVPMDAVADRQLQVELDRQQHESSIRDMLSDLIPEDGTPVRRKDVVEQLCKNYGCKKVKCYRIISDAIKQGWLVEIDRLRVKLKA